MIELTEYFITTVVVICLTVGWLIKNLSPIENKFIPLIVGILGVILATWNAGFNFTPEILATGLVSGLGSTGLYELIDNLVNKNAIYEEKENDEDT